MRAPRRLAFPLLLLLALPALAAPPAGAEPGGAACPGAPSWDLGVGAEACLGAFEAGSQVPVWGGACVWVSGNQTGVDPQHDCGIEGA